MMMIVVLASDILVLVKVNSQFTWQQPTLNGDRGKVKFITLLNEQREKIFHSTTMIQQER
jgi:hypothetical protein